MIKNWRQSLRDICIRPEPPVLSSILEDAVTRFSGLPAGATVCIKVSAAHDLPYPFTVSYRFVAQVVAEIYAVNPGLRILLTEGGVGERPVLSVAERHGLTTIPHAEFVDAEASEAVCVPNLNSTPHTAAAFWLPAHWVHASARILLTTCKIRSHHFQRWYSGGTRNLIGLLPRAHYRMSSSRRDMRSLLHQRGLDATVADLYTTTGINVLTILDARLLARQDEHLPLRFTRSIGRVIVADDPFQADERMAEILRLPFTPPYLTMIRKSETVTWAVASPG